jgi:hypothetical protein
MHAIFKEFPAFARLPERYLDDDAYRRLQGALMADPQTGDVIEGMGGVRKMRFVDGRRKKGTRGGLRIHYFHWEAGAQFWMFMVYDKGEVDDMTPSQRKLFRAVLKRELASRSS